MILQLLSYERFTFLRGYMNNNERKQFYRRTRFDHKLVTNRKLTPFANEFKTRTNMEKGTDL